MNVEDMHISVRLQRLLQVGNLTVADLARWFDRPYPTVRGWLNGGQVGGAPLDTAWITARLVALEKRLAKKQGLPVPRMSQRDRIDYINKL